MVKLFFLYYTGFHKHCHRGSKCDHPLATHHTWLFLQGTPSQLIDFFSYQDPALDYLCTFSVKKKSLLILAASPDELRDHVDFTILQGFELQTIPYVLISQNFVLYRYPLLLIQIK